MKWKIITICIFIIKHFSNFLFTNPKYIIDIYNIIKIECHEHYYVRFFWNF